MGEQSKMSSLIRDWIPKRKATVHTLRVLADKLMAHHNKVCKAQVAGSSSSVAGFVLLAVGFGLSFVTFGTSLILSGVGGGICAAGGLTTAGASIAELCIEKDTLKDAQKIIEKDREASQAIERVLQEQKNELCLTVRSIQTGASSISIGKNVAETSFKLGTRAGALASEGGEALFRGLGVAGKVFHIGGFAVSSVLLPVDIYTLVTSSMEIDASRKGKKVKEPGAVKRLRNLATELEQSLSDTMVDEIISAST